MKRNTQTHMEKRTEYSNTHAHHAHNLQSEDEKFMIDYHKSHTMNQRQSIISIYAEWKQMLTKHLYLSLRGTKHRHTHTHQNVDLKFAKRLCK